MPKDPRAIFALAAPLYDFSVPTLKPWHLKATFQSNDDKGNPSEEGTFEYWWASPGVYRVAWTRPGGVYSEWHTADGKIASKEPGPGPTFFERKLRNAFISPLPDSDELDPAKARLYREEMKFGNAKLPCIMLIPPMPQQGKIQDVPMGLFPTYCFDPNVPVLRVSYSFGSIATIFNQIEKVQGLYVPQRVTFYEGKHLLLSAKLLSVEGISPNDPALTPSEAAIKVNKVSVSPRVTAGMLEKRQVPVYPDDAKEAHVSGNVVLQATIGRDGKIHDLHVIRAPWPSLAASALMAVSQWEYKPYLFNGEPVEVETVVNVIFSLGR